MSVSSVKSCTIQKMADKCGGTCSSKSWITWSASSGYGQKYLGPTQLWSQNFYLKKKRAFEGVFM